MTEEGNLAVESQRVPDDLVDRMTDAVMGMDPEGRFTYLNDRAMSILRPALEDGTDPDDLVGEVFWEVLPRGDETTLYSYFGEAMADQRERSYEDYYPPLDAWFDVRLYPSESGVSVYFRDVTERREDRKRLERREAALRDVYEAVARTDRTFEERVDALLAIGQDVLGTEYGTLSRIDGDRYAFEVVRSPPDTVAAGDVIDLDATICERVVAEEETLVLGDVERDAPELTDRDVFTEMGITCYLGAPVFVDGDPYGTLCFYDTDPREGQFSEWETTLVDLISRWIGTALERKLTADELRRQNDRLDEFAKVLSHDLRNPLQVAQGNLELALEGDDTGPGAPEGAPDGALDDAQDAIERIDDMISDVLTMARAGREVDDLATEAVGLGAVSRDAWDATAPDTATLVLETDGTVDADPDRLRRVLENLFRNSVEHAGPDVTVTVASTTDGFAVADDGPGIPADERSSVFDHGYTTSADGTGFGLSIVAEIASAHGWDVSAADSADGGTRIEFDELQ